MKRVRLYCDTSVIGGCFDPEFREHSRRLFAYFGNGRAVLLVSAVVLRELRDAPGEVQAVLAGVPPESVKVLAVTAEVAALRDSYVEAGIVRPRWMDDGTHVSLATVSHADAIVSWNFRHIVHLDKMRGYNRVNLTNGYGLLSIVSPAEVRLDDNDDEE